MAKLSELISYIETTFNTSVTGIYSKTTQIKYIRLLTKYELESNDSKFEVLYLADYEKTDCKNATGNVLYTNCSRVSIPNALCTTEKNLFGIYNVLEKVLEQFAGEEQKKKNIFTLLHQTDDIQPLLDEGFISLGVPITVVNSGFTVIGSVPLKPLQPFTDKSKHEITLGKEFVDRMNKEGIKDKLIHLDYPFELRLPILEAYAVFCSIRIKKSVIGYLFINCGDRHLSKEDLEYVYVLAQAISIQLQKNYSYQNPRAVQFHSFLKELLEGNIKSSNDIPTHALDVKIKPYDRYFFICCCFKELSKDSSINFQLYEISQILNNSITFTNNDYFISLISMKSYEEYIENHEYRLLSFLTLNKMIASISFQFDDLTQAKYYYNQAIYILDQNQLNPSNKTILYYKDYYVNHLMYISKNKNQLMATVNYKITDMIKYDQQNNTNYSDTLIKYIKNNRNAPETAKSLYIHKSTLFYRFNKMKELFSIDLNDYNECFSYEHSFRFFKLI